MSSANSLVEKFTFLTSEGDIGLRIDVFLSKNLAELSREKIKESILAGYVFCNGKKVLKAGQKILSTDEKFVIFENPSILENSKERSSSLKEKALKKYNFRDMILFEDDHIIVVNKPAGLLSQKKSGDIVGKEYELSISELMLEYLISQNENVNCDLSVWEKGREFIVHRLDKETSGLMILTKTIKAFESLKIEFQERRVIKKYKGIVWGVPNPRVYKIENYVRRDNVHRTKMLVCTNKRFMNKQENLLENEEYTDEYVEKKGQTKIAITNYFVKKILFNGAMSFVEFEIETGRTHQIRLQMEFVDHPIVLDKVYFGGNNKFFLLKRAFLGEEEKLNQVKNLLEKINRHLLNSYSLSFFHPEFGTELNFNLDEANILNDLDLVLNKDLELCG